MAAAMAADIFTKAGLTADVLSAGVNAWANQPASRHALSVMEECGLSLAAHQACLISDNLIQDATLILSMTGTHRAILLSDYPKAKSKIYTLCEYAGQGKDISDPFGGSLEEYRTCAHEIRALLIKITDKLKESQ